ncbi:hypothetical protein OROGR_025628 [Orobanche gracilis]
MGYNFRNANDFLAERKKARDKIRNEFYEISYNSFIKQHQKLQHIKTCVELIRLGRPILWNAWEGASSKGKDPQVPVKVNTKRHKQIFCVAATCEVNPALVLALLPISKLEFIKQWYIYFLTGKDRQTDGKTTL